MGRTVVLVFLLLAPTGCVGVTNRVIRGSYADYNETIAYNQSQQMLLNLVRLRYRELPMFLKVGALSASYSFSVDGSATGSGLGAANVIGAHAGANFASRPTITYTPIEGNTFVKQLLGEIDPSTFVLLFRSGWPMRTLCNVMLERLGPAWNSSDEPSFQSFHDAVEALDDAQDENRLAFVSQNDALYLQITGSTAGLEILGATSDKEVSILPISLFQIRSLMDVMFYLAKNTEVPKKHLSQVRESDPNGWLNIEMHKDEPKNALVWVRHNGRYFSIARQDVRSKDTFSLVKMLFEIQAGDIRSVQPILTLPIAQP